MKRTNFLKISFYFVWIILLSFLNFNLTYHLLNNDHATEELFIEDDLISSATHLNPQGAFRKDWNWTGEFDGSIDPELEGWSLSENMAGTAAKWNQYNGIINISTKTESGVNWYYSKTNGFNPSNGYTINFRMKVNDGGTNAGDREFVWSDGVNVQGLQFTSNNITLKFSISSGTEYYEIATNDTYHDYWITVKDGLTKIWIDKVSVWSFINSQNSGSNLLYFGDISTSGTDEGESLWNYIRWYNQGEIEPWYETLSLWTQTSEDPSGSQWIDWRNEFDCLWSNLNAIGTFTHFIDVLDNYAYERTAIAEINTDSTPNNFWRYALAELAPGMNDTIFNMIITEYYSRVDSLKHSPALKAIVIGDEEPMNWNNSLARYVKYDRNSFNFTQKSKTASGRVEIGKWVRENNTAALNRIYYALKDHLKGYDIEVYQHPFWQYELDTRVNDYRWTGINLTALKGDGYATGGTYYRKDILENYQYQKNIKLYILNRYTTIHPNKPVYIWVDGGVNDLTKVNISKDLLRKDFLDITSVPGIIHTIYFSVYLKNAIIDNLIDKSNPYYEEKFEDMWDWVRNASYFIRRYKLSNRESHNLIYIMPLHHQFTWGYSMYLSQACWIPRTINYDVYFINEIMAGINQKPIEDYDLIIFSIGYSMLNEEIDEIKKWRNVWKVWSFMMGYVDETGGYRGVQKFWNVTGSFSYGSPPWMENHIINASKLGVTFNYTFNSTHPTGEATFDNNGESLITMHNISSPSIWDNMFVKYNATEGYGEYWIGHARCYSINGSTDDLFRLMITYALEDRGFSVEVEEPPPDSIPDDDDDDDRESITSFDSLAFFITLFGLVILGISAIGISLIIKKSKSKKSEINKTFKSKTLTKRTTILDSNIKGRE